MDSIAKHNELKKYIKKAKKQGFPEHLIKQKLLQFGWDSVIIEKHLPISVDLTELRRYVKTYLSEGFHHKHIKKKLIRAGWPKKHVNKHVDELKKEHEKKLEQQKLKEIERKKHEKELQKIAKQLKPLPTKAPEKKEAEEIAIAVKKARKETFFQKFRMKKLLKPVQFSEFKPYLFHKEVVQNKYFFKWYAVLLTNKRLIVMKRYPRNLFDMEYKDIDFVEYYTIIKWKYLFYAFLSAVIVYTFLANPVAVIETTVTYMPPIFDANIIFGLNLISFLIVTISGFLSIMWIIRFVHSLKGKMRVFPKHEEPVDIPTKLTAEVKILMKMIDERVEGS